jgi:hypothetical protein
MEEYGETKDKEYPRGRGYGNDYMRGGEVFGGYGYSKRAEYDRPRGDGQAEEAGEREATDEEEDADPPSADGTALEGREGDDGDEASGIERFPQDERAGGWDVPHDLPDERNKSAQNGAPPEAAIEHTFGDTGGSLTHSRSYYVTQAQLQHRLVERER